MGTSSSLTRSEASNTLGTWKITTGKEVRQQPGGLRGRTEEACTCEQATLSTIVVESAELGLEQALAGGSGGVQRPSAHVAPASLADSDDEVPIPGISP
jgi:hypothetical protein